MKITMFQVGLAIVIILLIAYKVYANKIYYAVSQVIDGDTIIVKKDKKVMKIRLYGIDAPEIKQPFGYESKHILKGMIENKLVSIDLKWRDKYGRIIGIVYLGKKCINEIMVKKGMAWVYKEYCKTSKCKKWKKHEQKARHNLKGLWFGNNPIYPQDWRHRN